MLTPGCNEKRYLDGAWNPKFCRLIYVEGERKNSLLFLELLHKLATKVGPSKVLSANFEQEGGAAFTDWVCPLG